MFNDKSNCNDYFILIKGMSLSLMVQNCGTIIPVATSAAQTTNPFHKQD